ncbi:SAT [Newlavirus]|uniref:SAT n=1 Tax=Newlavirus TaxID=2880839 RepID=A0AAX2ZBG8_9VIRU|nr:SAT [Newlavirus]UBZ25789.1 SAT [Newlavirus]UBZ25819.1 SAT [Newlavirus]
MAEASQWNLSLQLHREAEEGWGEVEVVVGAIEGVLVLVLAILTIVRFGILTGLRSQSHVMRLD